jgi:hypothetical protein
LSEDRVRDAQQAEYILTHPLTVAAFRDIENTLNEALTAVNEKDVEQMKNLVLMKKLIKRFKLAFETHINTGKIADKELLPKRHLFSLR